jgi:hypothetical protein
MSQIHSDRVLFRFGECLVNGQPSYERKELTLFIPTAGMWEVTKVKNIYRFSFNEVEFGRKGGDGFRTVTVESLYMPCIYGENAKPNNKYTKDKVTLSGVRLTYGSTTLETGRKSAHFHKVNIDVKSGTWAPYSDELFVDEAKVDGNKTYSEDFPSTLKRTKIKILGTPLPNITSLK